MGLFSRKPKHPAPRPGSPATEHGSPLSPPEARYANARSASSTSSLNAPPPPSHHSHQQRSASPSLALPKLAPPRSSSSFARSRNNQDDDADDGSSIGSSLHPSRRLDPIERQPSDASTWTLPALGLSPPSGSSLAPPGLGLLDGGSTPPEDSGIGLGLPPLMLGTDSRSSPRGSLIRDDGPSFARSASPSSFLYPTAPALSSATPTSTSFAASHTPPPAAPSPSAAEPSFIGRAQGSVYDTAYDNAYDNDDDDQPLARPPPLSSHASSGPPSPASSSGGGSFKFPPARRRFLGLFSGGSESSIGGGAGSSGSSSKGKDKASRLAVEDEPFGLAYESHSRSHALPTTTSQLPAPTVTTASSAPIPIAPTPADDRPSANPRRPSASSRYPKSPTSPSLSIEAELQTLGPPAATSSSFARPARPSAGQRSTSFFSNALRVSIASSSSTSAKSPNAAAPAELRPPSPAESFRVISARRITTPDEPLLSESPLSGVTLASASGGWLGARPRPEMGERKRSQSHEWSRSSPAGFAVDSLATSPYGGVEELRSPDKEREDEQRDRRMSVGLFRRRRSSVGFEGQVVNVLDLGRDVVEPAASQEQPRAEVGASAVADSSDDDDDDNRPLGMLRASNGRSTPTLMAVPATSPLSMPSTSLPSTTSSANLSTSLHAAPPPSATKPSLSGVSTGFNVSSRPTHQRGYSLTLPSPTASSPSSSTVDGDHPSLSTRPITPTPTNPNLPPSAAAPQAFPPRSSSLQSMAQQVPSVADGRDVDRPRHTRSNGDAKDQTALVPPAVRPGSQSMPASPKRRPESALSNRSPAASAAPLPVGTRPVRPGGPLSRPTSRYEMAKAAAASRKAVISSTSSSDEKDKNGASSSSSDDDVPLRPASRASTAMRPHSPATSLAPALRNPTAAAAGRSPRQPLLTLPQELEKPVLDRQRSVRRASVGDADQILLDVASAKSSLAAASAARTLQPSSLRPVGDHGLGGRAPARRRGSESVLARMEKERLATHAEDSDTSDGYGQDDGPVPSSTGRQLAATPKPSFLKQKAGESSALEIPAFSNNAPSPTHRKQLDNASDESDSDDDRPLRKLVPSQSPGRTPHKALSSASNPTLRVIAASPQTTPALPAKAGRSSLSRSTPEPVRSASTNSLSSLASSSTSSSAASVAMKAPAPKSILRRTSFADELSTAARPDRMSVYSTSPSPGVTTQGLPRPGSSRPPRSASTTSIPSPTTSTHFPPRPPFHTQPRSAGSPSSSSASGRTTGESSSGILPITPRESLDTARQGTRTASFGQEAQSVVGDVVADDSPDEAELERKRNERRRNEAKKAVKLGNYANGSAPHPDHEHDDEVDERDSTPSGFPPFPPQPLFHSHFANPYTGGGMPSFPAFSPGGGFMDPNAMYLFQMQMQAQQAQLAMQMSMAQMGGADPAMQYQAMMMAKAQFQQTMAAQAAQMAADSWEMSSMGGGAMSEAGGFPTPTMGGLGMGHPGGFNPAMNRFPSGGSMYGGGPGYAASAYGGTTDMSQRNAAPPPQMHANNYSSSRSDYGGVASSSGARRERMSSYELSSSQPPSRDSFYGGNGGQSRSSTNLHADGRPPEQDYYQQSRIPQQHHARPRVSSNLQSATSQQAGGRRTSFASGSSKPLVSFSTSPDKPSSRLDPSDWSNAPPRTRATSSTHAGGGGGGDGRQVRPLVPPSAPFAREGRPASPRSSSPNPPSSWKAGI